MAKPLAFRDLRRALLAHDSRFEFRQGKGSEMVLSHPDFRPSCSLPHHGDGDTVGIRDLLKIERAFGLPRGFFDPRHHERKAPAPAPTSEFAVVPMPPITRDPLFNFIRVEDGMVFSYFGDVVPYGWVNVHRTARCAVCNEDVQDNGEPCFWCGTMPDPSLFDPRISGGTPTGGSTGSGRRSSPTRSSRRKKGGRAGFRGDTRMIQAEFAWTMRTSLCNTATRYRPAGCLPAAPLRQKARGKRTLSAHLRDTSADVSFMKWL